MIAGPERFRLHRPIDIGVAIVGLLATSPLLALAWMAAGAASGGSGFFRQTRLGRQAEPFEIVKLRTMRADAVGTSITTLGDDRITAVGRLLRRSKFDEVPQLINVIRGEMALLGPRPDVPGYADLLQEPDRQILEIRPGITGPASLACVREEELLAAASNPEEFNSGTLYPLKTAINRAWQENGTLADDARLLFWTVKHPGEERLARLVQTWAPDLSLDPLQPTG